MVKKILAVIAALIVILISFPYLKAEYLTARYGFQFEDLYMQTHMIGSDYCKVLDYDGSHARCVYVEKGVTTCVLEFKCHDGDWELTYWECVWSSSGSADDLMWPLYF